MSEETYTYNFVNNSKKAQEIQLMSNEDIAKRYLKAFPNIRSQTDIETREMWSNDFFDQAYLPDKNDNTIYAHSYTASVSGKPLSYIATELLNSVLIQYAKEEGVKINTKTLVEDLEMILKDNHSEAIQCAAKRKTQVGSFIQEVTSFFVETLLGGIIAISDYSNSETAPLSAEDCETHGIAEVTD